jgi:hypothetical protein
MGWNEVQSSFAKPWAPKKAGEKLEGHFAGTEEVPSGRKDDEGKKKFFTSWRVRIKDGSVLGMAGEMLKSKMNQIPVGSLIRVEYLGKSAETSNGKAHDFKVLVDNSVKLTDPYLGSGTNGAGAGEIEEAAQTSA